MKLVDLVALGLNMVCLLEVRRRGVFQGWSCCTVGEWRGQLPKGSCTFRGSDKDLDALWPALWQSSGAKERPVHSAACQRGKLTSKLINLLSTPSITSGVGSSIYGRLLIGRIPTIMAPSKNVQSASAKNHRSEASGTRLLGDDLFIHLFTSQFRPVGK